MGVLFQYDPATNIYIKKLEFYGGTSGTYPYGSLMQASDGKLYGTTNEGGVNNMGLLFQYDPATNTYTMNILFFMVAILEFLTKIFTRVIFIPTT